MSNWMLDVERIVRELRRQKAKYHAKVLKDTGVWANWVRTIETSELFWNDAERVMFEINYLAPIISILFDIPAIDVQPLDVEFNIRLPTPEEIMQGIYFVADRLEGIKELLERFRWLSNVEDFIRENIVEKYIPSILRGRPIKAIYNDPEKGIFYISPYNLSYYDPPAVREFTRSSVTRITHERKTDELRVFDIRRAYEIFGTNPAVVYMLITRILFMIYLRFRVMVLGYSYLGLAYLGKPSGNGLAEVELPDADGRLLKVLINTLDHVQIGFILGVTPLGYGVLLPKESIYKLTDFVTAVGHITKGGPPFIELVDYRLSRVRRRYIYTPIALANYARPEERRDYLRSERADQWYELQLLRYMVENIVEGVVGQREANPVKKRMYKTAALQLVSAKARRHKWGYGGFEAMSEEEFVQWWRSHWERMGLNPSLLDEIYRRLKPILPRLRWEKWLKGERLRRQRFMAARLASL